MSGIETQVAHLALSLLAVIFAIVGFAFLYKRFGQGLVKNTKHLKILASLPLGTREKLIIVQVGDEQLLLGATNHTISTLHKLTAPLQREDNK